MNIWQIELLTRSHQCVDFDCGEQDLNVFLRKYASQNARRNISRTYVAVPKGSKAVAGYYTLSNGSVAFSRLPPQWSRRLPKYPIPTAHLGRLAVGRHQQGQGLGGVLLVDALRRVRSLADTIGIHAITVQAIGDAAKRFYKAYGFLVLQDDRYHLFLPMATIQDL